MMSIGEFAHLTGLTIKALRLYDERGLLVAAEIDPHSRHRRYAARQLRTAARIQALREAGLGLDEVAAAVRDVDRAPELLAAHTERVRLTREAEDRAGRRAANVLADLERRPTIEVRDQPAQPYAAVVTRVSADASGVGGQPGVDEDAATEEANAAFGALWQALAAAGATPTGPFWSSMRAVADNDGESDNTGGSDNKGDAATDPGAGAVELLLCWSVEAIPAGLEVPGHRIETGVIPAGAQLSCRWDNHPVGDEPPGEGLSDIADEAVLHPATIVLLEEVERRGGVFDLSGLRQIGSYDGEGQIVGADLTHPI
ncbi:MAG: MerR family transcriptional regulator [Propionibacteriales bacterium]|nr:MerR family transcriptional regulator [Propionibacteriales bacterium]